MPKKELRLEDVRELLEKLCHDAGGQREFARQHGLNVAYVSQVILGRRPPSDDMCKILGLKDDGRRWVRV